MKQRVINGNALEFFDSANTKKGEIKISGSNIIINPLDASGTVIFGEEGTVNDIEVGAVGTPVDFTFAGGGTITPNGGTLTIGNSGDTIDLSSATIGAITASAFVGGTFEGNGAGLTNVVPNLTSYNGDVGITGSLNVDGQINLSVGDYITFYGNNSKDHSIVGRDINGATSDDLRINSFDSLYLNLDSNNNSPSSAFIVGHHGGNTGTVAEVFRVQEDGKVGIGTNSPQETFHVSGSVRIDGAGSGAVQEQGGSTPSTALTNGDPNYYMGEPDTYLKIVIDGTTYIIPAYSPA